MVILEDGAVILADGVYFLNVVAEVRFQITAYHWDLTGSRLTSDEPFSVVYGPR